jgi:hypothetical protein
MVINSVDLLRPFKERSIYLCVGVRFPGAVAVLSQGCRSISLAWYPLSDIPCWISLADYSYKYISMTVFLFIVANHPDPHVRGLYPIQKALGKKNFSNIVFTGSLDQYK